jgi:N-acetyl-anhydromuramyl-L-alanine amidase AmpD
MVAPDRASETCRKGEDPMAQSAEYPDLKWVPARAYGTGRDGKAVRYIVIHYTAGAERSTSAEDGAVYDARRSDGTSTHYFVDSNSVVQCVHTKNRANAARHKGNRLGIQYELCGTVQTRAQWLDAASLPTLKNAARQVARDCRKYGIPVRRLSVVETRRAWTEFPDGPRGIVGHVDCTLAYPEDGGDHTDPGAGFPWDVFLDLVRAEMIVAAAGNKEDDMPLTPADKAWIKATVGEVAAAVWNKAEVDPYDKNVPPRQVRTGTMLRYAEGQRVQILDAIKALGVALAAGDQRILDAIDAIDPPEGTPADEPTG